jgi:hypothetical protein
MRRIHRSDLNAAPIVKCARQLGIVMVPIGRPTDYLAGIGGVWYCVEIKGPRGTYTIGQEQFKALCEEKHLPMLTWRSVDDMLGQLTFSQSSYAMTDSIDSPQL